LDFFCLGGAPGGGVFGLSHGVAAGDGRKSKEMSERIFESIERDFDRD